VDKNSMESKTPACLNLKYCSVGDFLHWWWQTVLYAGMNLTSLTNFYKFNPIFGSFSATDTYIS